MVRSIFFASAAALSVLAGAEAHESSTSSSSSSTHSTTHTHTSTDKHGSSTTSFTSTFSIPTAATAASTAAEITIDGGKEYIQYSTVGGYFLQDLNTTVASTFDYVGSLSYNIAQIHI